MMMQGKSKDSARSCPFCRKLAARERDRSEVTQLEKLIESCNGEACMQLGSFISQGDFGLEVDNVKATELFLKAGKLGCAGGYFNLGEFYRAVEVDEKKAQAEIIEAIVKVEKEIVETGDILANITLFDNLEKSNVISDDIKIKVSEGQKTDEYINTFSEK